MSENIKKQQVITGLSGGGKGNDRGLSGSPMTETKKRWLKVSAVAQNLSCTERHVYDLIVAGSLEATKIGSRAVRVSEVSLLAFVEKNKINPEDFFDPDKEKKVPAPVAVAKPRWMRP